MVQLQGGTQAWGTPTTPTYPGGIQGYAMVSQPQPGLSFNIGLNRLASAAPQPAPLQGGTVSNTVVGPTVNTNQVYEPHVNYTQKIDQRAPAMVPGLPNYHMPDVQALNVPALQMPQQMPQQPPPAAPVAYAQPPATAPLSFDLERAPNTNIYAQGFGQDLDNRPARVTRQPQYDYPESIPQTRVARRAPAEESEGRQYSPADFQLPQQQQQPYTQPYSAGQGQGQQQDGGLEAEMERVWGPNWRQQQQTGNTPAPRPEDYQEDDGAPRAPSYPQVAAKRGFWPALAAAMVGTPGARDLYTKRQAAQAEALKTQYTEQNANYRAELNAQTEMAKASMTGRSQGKLTMEQALKEAAEIERKEPDDPNKIPRLVRLQAAAMAAGLPLDFSDIATRGVGPERAAEIEKHFAETTKAVVDAQKSVKTLGASVAKETAEAEIKMRENQSSRALFGPKLQADIAEQDSRWSKYTADTATMADDIKQRQAQAQGAVLSNIKTQQGIAGGNVNEAMKYHNLAANYQNQAGNAKAMGMDDQAKQLQAWASEARAKAQSLEALNPQGAPPAVQGYLAAGQGPPPAMAQQPMPQQQAMVNPPTVPGVPPPPPVGGGLQPPPQAQVMVPQAPKPGTMLQDPNIMQQALGSARSQLGIPANVKLDGAAAQQVGNMATQFLEAAGWKLPTLPQQQQQPQQAQQPPRRNGLAAQGVEVEDLRHRPHAAPQPTGPAPVYDSSGRAALPGLEQQMDTAPGQYQPQRPGQFLEPHVDRAIASHFVQMAQGDPKLATHLAQHAGWNTEDPRSGRTTFGVRGNWGREPTETERLFGQLAAPQPAPRNLRGGAKVAGL